MTRYTATAKNLAGLLDHEPENEVSRAIEKAIVDAVMEEREACALLHEQVDVTEGRNPMSVVIEYRDRIRSR